MFRHVDQISSCKTQRKRAANGKPIDGGNNRFIAGEELKRSALLGNVGHINISQDFGRQALKGIRIEITTTTKCLFSGVASIWIFRAR